MDINSFVPKDCFEAIKRDIDGRRKFNYERKYKEKSDEITVRFQGVFIGKELADLVWGGLDYLVHFDVNYHGKNLGIGGTGFAIAKFEMFDTWSSFKKWFDGRLKRFPEYEVEEYGQMCLF